MMQTPADLLVNALHNPHDPRLCGSCMIGCLEKIFPSSERCPGSSKRRTNIISGHHDVWNALIFFIATKRTNKQMQHLLTRLSRCSRKATEAHIQELHRLGDGMRRRLLSRSLVGVHLDDAEFNPSSLSPMVIGTCFPIDIFSLLYQVLLDVGVKSVAKGSAPWPRMPTELLPCGADVFAGAMLQWQSVLNDSLVFGICGFALRLCRDLLLPSLVSHTFCDHLVRAGRTLFDWYMPYLVAEDRSAKGLQAAKVFKLQLYEYQVFLTGLFTQEAEWKASLARGCETKLTQLCSLLVHVTTDPRYPERNGETTDFRMLVNCGQLIYRLFHMHLPPRPLIALHPEVVQVDSCIFPPPDSVRSLQETTILTIQDYKAEHRCSGLNCTNSLQSVGRNFQRCGRCYAIPYCGRKCQRQDWRNESFPHSRVCPILRDLIEKGGGWPVFMSGRGYFEVTRTVLRNWTAAGVSEEDLEYVDDWRKDREKRKTMLPDGTEWTPGFDDYDRIIWQFGASGKGPKPCYSNRLARWPCEVAKVKEVFEIMPFWEQEIV